MMADDEIGEYYSGYKNRPNVRNIKKGSIEEDVALLELLYNRVAGFSFTRFLDKTGLERFEITVTTERGIRMVDWWTSQNVWKVRRGRGQGTGIRNLVKYFNITPLGGWENLDA
jgi:hypothetical protein